MDMDSKALATVDDMAAIFPNMATFFPPEEEPMTSFFDHEDDGLLPYPPTRPQGAPAFATGATPTPFFVGQQEPPAALLPIIVATTTTTTITITNPNTNTITTRTTINTKTTTKDAVDVPSTAVDGPTLTVDAPRMTVGGPYTTVDATVTASSRPVSPPAPSHRALSETAEYGTMSGPVSVPTRSPRMMRDMMDAL
jgi:hypothetical protein